MCSVSMIQPFTLYLLRINRIWCLNGGSTRKKNRFRTISWKKWYSWTYRWLISHTFKKHSDSYHFWPLITIWGHFQAPIFKRSHSGISLFLWYDMSRSQKQQKNCNFQYTTSIFQIHSLVCQLDYSWIQLF